MKSVCLQACLALTLLGAVGAGANPSNPAPPEKKVKSEATGRVIGPTKAEVKSPVFFTLEGIPPEHLKKVNWGLFPKCESDQFVQLFDTGGRSICFFWSSEPGLRAVLVDTNVPDQYQLIVHELQYGRATPPGPGPIPVPEPTAELRRLVEPVKTKLKGHRQQALRLQQFYLDLADVVRRDSTVIRTTAQFRTGHERSFTLAFQDDWKPLGLKEPIDSAFAATLGLEVAEMDAAKRTKVVEVCSAIAHVCGEVE